MRFFATLVTLLLMLSASARSVACVATEVKSVSQAACCRAMHDACGDMEKTGCCRAEVKSEAQPAVVPSRVVLRAPVLVALPVWAPIAFRLSAALRIFTLPEEHSPPGWNAVRLANLRI